MPPQSVLRRELRRESAAYPPTLVRLPQESWPSRNLAATLAVAEDAWRSRDFLVVLWREGESLRLSVQRVGAAAFLREKDLRPISWDDLQRLKGEAGYGDSWAVELFPPEDQVIDVAPMRHLWLLQGPPPFGWRVSKP